MYRTEVSFSRAVIFRLFAQVNVSKNALRITFGEEPKNYLLIFIQIIAVYRKVTCHWAYFNEFTEFE